MDNEISALMIFIAIVTAIAAVIRARNLFNKLTAAGSVLCFGLMIFIAIKNYPNEIIGSELNIMGFGLIGGLVFLLALVIKNIFLRSTS